MPIYTSDIKLLNSAVMADTTDGGGQMTGTQIVDGASNNLFPDTSAMDRAFGRVNKRKVFGVAHTDDTDTLLGAHAIITDAPDDPLVKCALMRTSGWADTRTHAKDVVERYVVKGPKANVRIWDTHYTGSLQLRLITFVGGAMPVGGDALLLHNPNGTEQYVRVLKVTISAQNIAVIENGATLVLPATIGTCDIAQALTMDVLGPPAARVYGAYGVDAESNFATLYTTNVANGAKFYSLKPLGISGTVGDLSVTTADGIYTHIVPAATVETPLLDQYPLLEVAGITLTAQATTTVTAGTSTTLGPGTVVTLPTRIEPRSVAMAHGAATFTDNGKGDLLQGSTVVGSVQYRTGVITMGAASPGYGSANTTVSYRAATGASAAAFSDARKVTTANQGLVFVESLVPAPARGTLSVSYMVQGKWYTLYDDLDGKVAGSDSSYGTGTINYSSGSVSVTLGAIPDLDSPIIYQWGEKASAQPFPDALPTAAVMNIDLPEHILPGSVQLQWQRLGVTKTASVSAARVLSGDATGSLTRVDGVQMLSFTMPAFPDGDIAVNLQQYAGGHSDATQPSASTVQLGTFPVEPGTVSVVLGLAPRTDFAPENDSAYLVDDGAGNVSAHTFRRSVGWYSAGNTSTPVGTINYTTGLITLTVTNLSVVGVQTYTRTSPSFFGYGGFAYKELITEPHDLALAALVSAHYTGGTGSAQTLPAAPAVVLNMPLNVGTPLATSDMAFTLGGELYTAHGGQLTKGWSTATGTGAAAGSVASNGVVTITALPASGTNTVVFQNAALNMAGKKINSGVFRTAQAPLKVGVLQLNAEGLSASANAGGVISGDLTGEMDFTRGFCAWRTSTGLAPATLRYNAVYLQNLPLDAGLLGLDTARLPLDGKVPIFHVGDLVVVHNTLSTTLPNPLTKNTVYDLGRLRIANVRVKDALGAVVPDSLYTVDLNLGTIVVPTAANITSYTQPLTVEHRIEDMLLTSKVDISGKLSFTRSLTHNFPAGTSYVSSAMPFGDLFARYYNLMEQSTWTSVWSDTLIGAPIIPQYNDTIYPLAVTNKGAIKERWVLIFTNTTAYRVVGESVGEIATGSTATPCAPLNPATGVPYFSIDPLGWGSGWSAGNCLRFNTDACGTPFWVVRTVLQGPASLESDQFTLAFRGDVDRP